MNESTDKPGAGVQMPPQYRRWLRVAAEFVVVSICTLAFAFTVLNILTAVLERNTAGTRDFVQYWASGQQLVRHANPYDREAILQMERSVGFPPGIIELVLLSPPTALPLVYPLGFFGSGAAELVWTLALLACLVASVRMVWRMHGAPKNLLRVFGYSFGPALVCLQAGQLSLFVLLGLVLFLRFHHTRPFVAGASLWLCALKPHLFLPFGVVLIVWVVTTRCYRILLGTASAFALSAVIAFVLDPMAWVQYSEMMRKFRVDRMPIPCLSNVFRRAVDPHALWVQYLPAAIACVWALVYFRRHRSDWNWVAQGSPLMLVSVLAAPYSWFVDQAILIPALLHGVFLTRSRGLLALLALASAVIEIGPLRGMPVLQSPFYFWTAPAWLAWYLLAVRHSEWFEEKGPSQAAVAVTPVPQRG